MSSSREPSELTLAALELATVEWVRYGAVRERLVTRALREGYSERRIGRSAGISGPAIHKRKVRDV